MKSLAEKSGSNFRAASILLAEAAAGLVEAMKGTSSLSIRILQILSIQPALTTGLIRRAIKEQLEEDFPGLRLGALVLELQTLHEKGYIRPFHNMEGVLFIEKAGLAVLTKHAKGRS